MKTFYLIKSFLPFVFLPIAPGVVQVELERHGVLTYGGGAFLSIFIQILFTVAVIVRLLHSRHQKNQAKAFLRMSCVSKKVFHDGRWMTVERYLADHHNITVSHGMTPEESTDWLRESEEWMRKEAELAFDATSEVASSKKQQLLFAK